MATKIRVEDSVAYHIYRCARLLRKGLLEISADAGLQVTPEQWFILNRLRRLDGQSQGELGDEDFADRPNLARTIATMERGGLVARRSDPDDGRRQRVWLTDEGKSAHDRLAREAEKERKRLFRELDAEEQRRTIAALRSIERACLQPR